MTPPSDRKDIAKIVDVRTAIVRAIAVLGATLLVFIAFKDKHKPRIPSPADRKPVVGDCQESQLHPVRKDIIAKSTKFLKDFF